MNPVHKSEGLGEEWEWGAENAGMENARVSFMTIYLTSKTIRVISERPDINPMRKF